MTKTQRGRLRRLWFNIHLWLGVGLAVLLIPLGLTGAVLVWTDQIEHAATPPLAASASLPPSTYLAAARAALGERARPVSLAWPARPGDPVVVTARPSRPGPPGGPRGMAVKLDPRDARVLSAGPPRPEWWRTVHGFHENLMNRDWGRPVVGWLGVAMLISSLTGIWLWWPRAGRLAQALRWRRAPGVWRSLHYTLGFWISLPLAFVSLTGIGLGFPQQTRALIAQVAPMSPPGAGAGMGGPPGSFGVGGGERGGRGGGHGGAPPWRPHLTPDAVVIAAGAPTGSLKYLTLPTRAKPLWRLELRDGRALELADADGRVAPGAPPPSGDVAWRWVHRLHGGGDLPLIWRLIVTLTGLAPTFFGVTGVSLWIARSLRKRAPRSASAA